MSRSKSAILRRLRERSVDLPFDFGADVLIACLPYEEAEPYLDESTTREEFEEVGPQESIDEWARQSLEEYLPFARKKSESKRGLSCLRSVQKIREWLWLLGEDEVLLEFNSAEYAPYAEPKLDVVEEYLGGGDDG